MADSSFNEVVATWIEANTWPRPADKPQSILILTAANSDGTVFNFHSAFSYLEILGTYHKDTSSLIDLQIKLVVPGKSEATTLTVADSYPLSTNEGQPLTFNLGDNYVTGTLSFSQNYNGQQNIFVTYDVHLPYAGDLEDTLSIAPTEATQAAGFTAERLKSIRTLTTSELKLVEEKARSRQVVIRALDGETNDQQALLVKFLKDFVVDKNSVVIETYYAPSGARASTLPRSGYSTLWEGTISFLGILELVGSIDPTSITVSAALYARVPIIGRVRLAGIEGCLLGTGASADINLGVASGNATFTASENTSGTHDLFVEASLTIQFYGTISTDGKLCILTLPF